MDTETKNNTNVKVKKSGRKNEKKKKMETQAAEVALDEVCQQIGKIPEDEGSASASSTDSEDLVNAINYNTITSLAALKDIIQGDNNDTPETDSFFQHYFMNHCNNLSSRNTSANPPFPFPERRRLSQCREEDEDDEKKEIHALLFEPTKASQVTSQVSLSVEAKDLSKGEGGKQQNEPVENVPKTSSQKVDDGPDPPNRTVMGARHKFFVTTTEPPPAAAPLERILRSQAHNAHTVHFGTKGAEEQRPSVRSIFQGQGLHRDKNYFDSSLIEIRSTVDESGGTASSEDIWIKRTDEKTVSGVFTQINQIT